MRNIAVCWDLDKTLTNVSGLTDKLLQIVLWKYDIDFNKDFLNRFRVPGLEWKPIEMRLKLLFWDELWRKYFQEFKELKTIWSEVPPLFEWIKEVIESTSGFSHMVVTNKEAELALQDIRWNWIEWKFKKIVTAWDTLWDEIKLKPSPYLLEFALLWLSSDSVIMIWDTAADINALLWVKWNNKFALLAWWGNTPDTLEQQVSLIKWIEWSDYLIIPTPEEVWTYLANIN